LKALSGQLCALAERQPVLLIVEDAQWIDPTTRELLDLLLRELPRRRILALVTYRHEGEASAARPRFHAEWSALAHALTLPLIRLSREDAAIMVHEVGGAKPLPAGLLERIVDKTDGVPLFIEELTQAVLESPHLVETPDSYRVKGSLPELAVPDSLHGSLTVRLERAAAPMREVAQVAACIGRHFSRNLLAAVTALDANALNDALRGLEDAGILLRGGMPGDGFYTFKHALVRDKAHDSLLKGARKSAHARIAAALAESAHIVLSAPETIAHHCMEAEDFGRATDYWHRAAKRAAARYANAEAIEHCRKGLAALSATPRSPKRTAMELKLRITLAECLRITDRYDEALAELSTAEAVAAQGECLLELSKIHHLRGNIYYPLGKPECFDEHKAALACARKAGSAENEALALGGLGDAHFQGRRILTAHDHFEDCVALSRARGHTAIEVAYLPMRAVTHMYCLRYSESLRDCGSVISLAAQLGRARGELISRSTSSWILLDQDEWSLAEEHARKGLEALEEIGA